MAKDKPTIHLEEIPEGARVYRDKVFLEAVLRVRHHTGQHKQVREGRDTVNQMVWDPLHPSQYSLHFTSPEVNVDLLRAILEAVDTFLKGVGK
jgi:hypothetical protein